MARIQILELPTVYAEDNSETPFAIIIDQADGLIFDAFAVEADDTQQSPGERLKAHSGARAILLVEGTLDIPANDYSNQGVNTVDGGTVSVKVVPDFSDFGPGVEAAVADANVRIAATRRHIHPCRDSDATSPTNAEQRLQLAKQALLDDGYFRPDEIGDDIAPRITERLTALTEELAAARAAHARKTHPLVDTDG